MKKFRPYIPLIGFVLPTVVVGYGIVIPRSCIAGVNELSIGFGTTLLGAVFTYFAGQRAILPRSACTKPPLRICLARAINRQAASPSGWFGRVLGRIWQREHAGLNIEVLDQLDVCEGHRVLEIGPGPGEALHAASRRTKGGQVVGIDVSELMAKLARRRNRRSVLCGQVDVRVGDVASLDFGNSSFDRIFSVHCIYFWHNVDAVVEKLSRALEPGGKLVLAFRPDSDDIPPRFRDAIYRFPRIDQVEALLVCCGLVIERSAPSTVASITQLITASKPAS